MNFIIRTHKRDANEGTTTLEHNTNAVFTRNGKLHFARTENAHHRTSERTRARRKSPIYRQIPISIPFNALVAYNFSYLSIFFADIAHFAA